MEVVQNLFYSKLSNPRTQRESIHSRLEVLTTEGGKMKRLMVVAVLLTVASLLWEPGLHAQAASSGQASTSSKDNQASIDQSVALLRQDLQSSKKQTIAANLKLTDAEATKFWPVYDQYSAELSKLGDQRYALIKEYAKGFGTLTDDQALSLIKRSLSLDEQVAQLRSKYVPIINQVLPGTKTATFFQMDRYINSLIDVQLAGAIPLAQEQK
jgi:predicted transposase YdaD